MVNFKNIAVISILIFAIAGCNSVGKYLPSDFDNVEYGKLVELNVVAASNTNPDGWCNYMILGQLNYRAEWLHTYSKHRLNDNITEIYKGLQDLTGELLTREDPSNAYCRIKRTNIHDITTNMLEVFGDRK